MDLGLFQALRGKERSWYKKGSSQKWTKDFEFLVLCGRRPYQTQEEWEQHGLDNNYDERNSTSLANSKDKKERSWYTKGCGEGWLNDFEFSALSKKSPYQTQEEWEQHGLDNNYNERNPKSLSKSKIKAERSWYGRGRYKEWVQKFEFSALSKKSPYQTQEEWEQHGLDNNYDERNITGLQVSKIKAERSWYNKGVSESWIQKFEFQKKLSNLQTFEEWEQHGLDNNYDERNSTSLLDSKDKKENSWYRKGSREGWLQKFEFQRERERYPSELKDIHGLVKIVSNIMEERGLSVLPGQHVLSRLGYNRVANAIQVYHGGFPAFREYLNNLNGIPSESEQLEGLLRDYVDEDGGEKDE